MKISRTSCFGAIMASTAALAYLGIIMASSATSVSAGSCPGSPATVHAKCEMKVTFPSTSCSVVLGEMTNRLLGKNGWTDPHNGGTYTRLSSEENKLEGSRVTGDQKYTDLFGIDFLDQNGDCVIQACSESQVSSVLDFSTNYCNLHSLYCNESEDGCSIVEEDLKYVETYTDCWQNKALKCMVTNSIGS